MDHTAIQLDELILGDGLSAAAVADRLRHAPGAATQPPETLDAIAASVATALGAELARLRS